MPSSTTRRPSWEPPSRPPVSIRDARPETTCGSSRPQVGATDRRCDELLDFVGLAEASKRRDGGFSVTTIDENAGTAICHPNAIFDEDEQRWIADTEVAEVPFTAFTSRRKKDHITAWLIVRRVRRHPKRFVQGGTCPRRPEELDPRAPAVGYLESVNWSGR